MVPLNIAVIGSGISGLSAAWLLSRSQNVTMFEKQARIGGHSNTVIAQTRDGGIPVDTGFIVFNEQNYPNLTAFLDHLGVATAESSMGFAVSVEQGRMEYSGKHLNGLFGQRRNIIRLQHWQLVSDILKFFKLAEQQARGIDETMTIAAFLDKFGYSRVFVEDHILPISAAIWSTPARTMLEFPAKTFIEFFANHGLLQVNDRPKWRTVQGGSREYIKRILAEKRFSTEVKSRIKAVVRHASGVEIFFEDGVRRHFDEVVFACHADEALALLADPTPDEVKVLSAFRFTSNRAVMHTDRSFMPQRRHLWSSWNYLRASNGEHADLSLTYWMNRLQPLPTRTDIFVSLNPMREPAADSVQYDVTYEHPLFDAGAIAAQHEMWRIQGVQKTWFAGAWQGYGFHEDGLQSGLEVAERIAPMTRPWAVSQPRSRIAHNWAGEERTLWAAE